MHYNLICWSHILLASISNKQPSVDPIKQPVKEKPKVSRQFSREIEKTEQPSEEVDKDLNSKSGPLIRVCKRKLFFMHGSMNFFQGGFQARRPENNLELWFFGGFF